MTYINASLLNDFQVTDATNEKYFSELGLIDAVKESTPFVDFIPPSAKEKLASVSSLRGVSIPVIQDQSVTVVTTPGFEFIPANLETSDVYAFTAYDVFSGFRHYPSTYGNNMVDQEYAVKQKIKNITYAMGSSIETILAARFEERKTQVLNFGTQVSQGDGTFTFDSGTDILTVSKAAQKETMFVNLEALMAANEVGGNYRLVTSRAGLAVQRSEALKYSAANSKNLQALGFWGADRLHESGNISASTDVFNGWLFRDGGMGVFENYPYDFRSGTKIDGKEWSISDMEIPFCRMRANIFTNAEPTNSDSLITSGSDSNTIMSSYEEMAIWVRFYVAYRYNSDLTSRVNDVVKIKGAIS